MSRPLRAARCRRPRLTAVALSAAVAVATVAPLVDRASVAPAQTVDDPSGAVAATARALYDRTMSPFCPGLTLAICPSPSADSLRKAIRAQLAAGASPSAIEAELIRTYGDVVRGAPAARGFGLVAWIAPAALLVAAGGWALVWLRRTTRRSGGRAGGDEPLGTRRDPAVAPYDGDLEAALRARLDAEVRRAG